MCFVVSSHFKNVTMVNRFSNLKRRENPGNASVTPVPKARSDSRETKISTALKEKPDTENPCKQITIQFKLYQKNMEHQSVHTALLYIMSFWS